MQSVGLQQQMHAEDEAEDHAERSVLAVRQYGPAADPEQNNEQDGAGHGPDGHQAERVERAQRDPREDERRAPERDRDQPLAGQGMEEVAR